MARLTRGSARSGSVEPFLARGPRHLTGPLPLLDDARVVVLAVRLEAVEEAEPSAHFCEDEAPAAPAAPVEAPTRPKGEVFVRDAPFPICRQAQVPQQNVEERDDVERDVGIAWAAHGLQISAAQLVDDARSASRAPASS